MFGIGAYNAVPMQSVPVMNVYGTGLTLPYPYQG